jgi:ribosomal-protein-alanine N-acetyltransferase
MELKSRRFILKSLIPDSDDLSSYLSWMTDITSNQFISGVSRNWDKQSLVDYVESKNIAHDAVLLGIFTQTGNQHIGNIKLEPIYDRSHAYLGILIGERKWRGRKVGTEVISTLLDFAFESLNLIEVRLGLNRANTVALTLYLKLGFEQRLNSKSNDISFEMSIDSTTWFSRRVTIREELEKIFSES